MRTVCVSLEMLAGLTERSIRIGCICMGDSTPTSGAITVALVQPAGAPARVGRAALEPQFGHGIGLHAAISI